MQSVFPRSGSTPESARRGGFRDVSCLLVSTPVSDRAQHPSCGMRAYSKVKSSLFLQVALLSLFLSVLLEAHVPCTLGLRRGHGRSVHGVSFLAKMKAPQVTEREQARVREERGGAAGGRGERTNSPLSSSSRTSSLLNGNRLGN